MKNEQSRAEKTLKTDVQPPGPGQPAPETAKASQGDQGPAAHSSAGGTAAQEPDAPKAPAAATEGEESTKPALKIPPILLEGDPPAVPPATGPGRKYALGPAPPAAPPGAVTGRLPEAYGTERLSLLARDPHWLYAQWDLTLEQQRRYNALSADHHLVVRVHPETPAGQPVIEAGVHPEARHWFIQVERAGITYVAELGYYQADRRWLAIATSAGATTPPDTVSAETAVRFATMPVGTSPPQPPPLPPEIAALVQLGQPVSAALPPGHREGPTGSAGVPAGVAEQTGSAGVPAGTVGQPELPTPLPPPPVAWTPAQDYALAEMIGRAVLPRHPSSPVTSVSSPLGGREQPPKGFWFSINAEIVIYGATTPDASVTLGGQPVPLRPDGTFSCRFALPDGQYELAAVATAPHGDWREALLRFSRRTQYRGEVGAQPQEPGLPTPAAENVS